MDCCNLASVILDHHMSPHISGNRSLFNSLLVVEFDIPWDTDQVETYGESFTAWDADQFTKAWTALRKALPHNQLAVVVPIGFVLFCFCFAFCFASKI